MFNRAWLAGGIPRTACVAAYEPICAVSLADSYINRANPGVNNAAPGTAPTWAAETGWTFNGTTQYLTTGIAPTNDRSWSMIIRFSNASSGYAVLAGSQVGSSGYFMLEPIRPDGKVLYGNGGIYYPSGQMTEGVIAVAGARGYQNGIMDASIIGTGTGTLPSIFIGCSSWGGAPAAYQAANIQALYIYNVPITPTQVKAVTDAMNMLPMRPQLPRFRSWLTGGALTQFRKAFGLRTGSRGVPD